MPRPVPKFGEFVGHAKSVRRLCKQLDGAKVRAESFPHILLIGPSGVGKTLLGESLAAKYGTPMVYVMGDITLPELRDKLTSLGMHDFLFIDEAHNLQPKCQELLYLAIDKKQIPRRETESSDQAEEDVEVGVEKSPFIPINSFTTVLATDQPSRLQNALQKRMGITERLHRYNQHEMEEIVDHLAAGKKLLISPQARNLLARVSCGLPRKAKLLLENLQRHYPNCMKVQIRIKKVRQFLRAFEIDAKGLGRTERNYLRYLLRNDKASLESLALHLDEGLRCVRREIESVLHRLGLIRIGSGGRQLTDRGRKWIERQPTKKKGSEADGHH